MALGLRKPSSSALWLVLRLVLSKRSTSQTRAGWFKERVLGQPEAVDLIVDLLATVKASLTRLEMSEFSDGVAVMAA